MKYHVYAFYPNLGIKIRVTEYSNQNEMYEYIGALRLCDTPYMATKNYENIIEVETYDLTREIMADMLKEYFEKVEE